MTVGNSTFLQTLTILVIIEVVLGYVDYVGLCVLQVPYCSVMVGEGIAIYAVKAILSHPWYT